MIIASEDNYLYALVFSPPPSPPPPSPPRLPALGRRFSQCRTAPTVPRPCRVMASGQQRRTWTCSCYNAVASPAAHSVQLRVGLPLALAASCSSFEAAVARGFKKMSAAATSRGTAQ